MQTEENKQLSDKRWQAMKLKSEYLQEGIGDKEVFRKLYIETENAFEKLPISAMSVDCKAYLATFDIERWYKQKNKNWDILLELKSDKIEVLKPENKDCNLFSFVFLMESEEKREQLRLQLIQNKLYPVVLWKIPDQSNRYALDISKRMISIPCDARYDIEDIKQMKNRLEKSLQVIVE